MSGRGYVQWHSSSVYVLASLLCVAFEKSCCVLMPIDDVTLDKLFLARLLIKLREAYDVCNVCTHVMIALKVLCNAALIMIELRTAPLE